MPSLLTLRILWRKGGSLEIPQVYQWKIHSSGRVIEIRNSKGWRVIPFELVFEVIEEGS